MLPCTGCASLLVRVRVRVRVYFPPFTLLARPRSHPHASATTWQYTMTPIDYARWRNRTALAALLETEASARGLTNATRSDEPN